jgi:hypothetical protein
MAKTKSIPKLADVFITIERRSPYALSIFDVIAKVFAICGAAIFFAVMKAKLAAILPVKDLAGALFAVIVSILSALVLFLVLFVLFQSQIMYRCLPIEFRNRYDVLWQMKRRFSNVMQNYVRSLPFKMSYKEELEYRKAVSLVEAMIFSKH